jgi:RNA polymerase sigma factor (TIGR02999 family)
MEKRPGGEKAILAHVTESQPTQLTQLLNSPDPPDSAALLALVYDQLRKTAQQRMNEERRDHTLQATALVHEAYLKLVGDSQVPWANRAHFFAAAAEAMRRILIDHARKRETVKRGGGVPIIAGVLDLASDEKIADALALDDLISRLETDDAQAAQVVRLRFYAGLSIDDTAATLAVAPRSVDRHWKFARAWLYRAIRDGV